jgi:hypothetical protein
MVGNKTSHLMLCRKSIAVCCDIVKKHINIFCEQNALIPVAARSKAWVCGHSFAGIMSSNTAGDMDVYCEFCVLLSGRGLCFGLITGPEKSYRVWCV